MLQLSHTSALTNLPWNFSLPPLQQGSDEEKRVAAVALCTVLELLRVAAVTLSPITPALSQRVYLQLGYTDQQYKVWCGRFAVLCCCCLFTMERSSNTYGTI